MDPGKSRGKMVAREGAAPILLLNISMGTEAMNQRLRRDRTNQMAVIMLRAAGGLRRAFRLGGVDKRKSPRVTLSIKVTTTKTGSFSFYLAYNISAGGMFLMCLEPLPVGTELELRFALFPHREEINLEAKVVWVRAPDLEGGNNPGMGVQFTRLTPQARAILESFVEMKL